MYNRLIVYKKLDTIPFGVKSLSLFKIQSHMNYEMQNFTVDITHRIK